MSTPTEPLTPPSSATDPQFPTPSASERDDTLKGILAGAVIVFSGGVIALFHLHKGFLTETVETQIIGSMNTLMALVVGYYFGSSSGAKSQLAQKEKQ